MPHLSERPFESPQTAPKHPPGLCCALGVYQGAMPTLWQLYAMVCYPAVPGIPQGYPRALTEVGY